MVEAEGAKVNRCPSCGWEVPRGRFCVRCGAELGGAGAPSRMRHHFAASPSERVRVPRVISTLFPQLPADSVSAFRWALVGGFALVLALTATRVLPVAFVAAAVTVPILMLIYLVDVDVYEDQPSWVLAATLIWGIVSGLLVGLLARGIAPLDSSYVLDRAGGDVALRGVALPLIGLAAMLAGPLVLLLPHRKFNDVLDGSTFGAASAVTFAATAALVDGGDLLGAGARPAGELVRWAPRLLTVAVANPVVAGASAGAAAGAFWLRYRAPVADRDALGLLGSPAVACLFAGVLLIGSALAQLLLAPWAGFLAALALAAVALVWLRAAIHVGLLEEAAEIPIGPAIRCANCRHETARHTFCSNCGIALRALPKPGAARRAAAGGAAGSEAPS